MILTLQDICLMVSDHIIIVIWAIKSFLYSSGVLPLTGFLCFPTQGKCLHDEVNEALFQLKTVKEAGKQMIS